MVKTRSSEYSPFEGIKLDGEPCFKSDGKKGVSIEKIILIYTKNSIKNSLEAFSWNQKFW